MACVCRPSAVCSARAAAEEPGGSPADAPAGARLEEDSAAAEAARSEAAGPARCEAAAVDDSSLGDFAAEEPAAADSSPVALADDCSGSDTRCALAVATGDSYPGDSSQADCWAEVDSPVDSAALQADDRCAQAAQMDDCCCPADSCPDGCCLADCSEPAGSVAGDSPGSADSARAGSTAVDSVAVCCSAD